MGWTIIGLSLDYMGSSKWILFFFFCGLLTQLLPWPISAKWSKWFWGTFLQNGNYLLEVVVSPAMICEPVPQVYLISRDDAMIWSSSSSQLDQLVTGIRTPTSWHTSLGHVKITGENYRRCSSYPLGGFFDSWWIPKSQVSKVMVIDDWTFWCCPYFNKQPMAHQKYCDS